MNCYLCKAAGRPSEITPRQMRQSDGLGDVHLLCKFNEIRRALGLRPFEEMRKLSYISAGGSAVRVHLVSPHATSRAAIQSHARHGRKYSKRRADLVEI